MNRDFSHSICCRQRLGVSDRAILSSVFINNLVTVAGFNLTSGLKRQLVTMYRMAAGTDDERAFQLRELGELARRNRELAAAQAYYEEASNLLRNSTNRLKFAHTVRHLGDVYAEQQDWSHAEPCFVEALDIYRSHPSPPALDLANAVRAYAALKSARGTHEEARVLWAEAGRLYEAAGITAGAKECKRRVSCPG